MRTQINFECTKYVHMTCQYYDKSISVKFFFLLWNESEAVGEICFVVVF